MICAWFLCHKVNLLGIVFRNSFIQTFTAFFNLRLQIPAPFIGVPQNGPIN